MSEKTNMHNISSVGQLINKLIDSYKLRSRYEEVKIITAWESVIPKAIQNRTRSLKFNNGVLVINVTSAPLRQELTSMVEELILKLNEELGSQVIQQIEIR